MLPLSLYLKIGGAVAGIALCLGIGWSVNKAYSERDELKIKTSLLETQLAGEQQRITVMQEQLVIWQDTVAKMNRAIKDIKVESNTYIQGVENAQTPVPDNNGVVPFIMPVVGRQPSYTNLPTSDKVIPSSGASPAALEMERTAVSPGELAGKVAKCC